MTTPTVFISYSHKDEDWKDRVVTHLRVLQMQDMLDVWDDRRIEAGDEWHSEIENALNAASVAVLLVSANFLTSKFILGEEVPRLLERREKEGVRIFPVIVKPCAWTQVKWLARMQARPKDGKPLAAGNEYQIDADLAAIAEEIAALIKQAGKGVTPGSAPLGPDKISTAKLPSTSSDLFGREKELALLDAAWNPHPNPPPSASRTGEGKTNVLTLVAWGGVGKSALVNRWLAQMAHQNYSGAERVYGWSFYSQGAAEGRQVSADPFIAAALEWFGDPEMARSAASPWQKGERLAELVKQQRTLLILDGLEPLQNPPPVETGCIKDPGLTALLRELARQNPGLVVITTRLAVEDLQDFVGSSTVEVDLDNLSTEAGAAYLKHLGVIGTPSECEEVSHEYKGHALALTLLGRYLVDVYDGDIRKRDLIPQLTEEEEKGEHAKRIMRAYEKWFEGKPERDILYILGLFDRPAEKGAIEALLAAPPIASLTTQLQNIAPQKWQLALKHLRNARLLAAPDPHDPDALDCHPLLREHFADQLRAEDSAAWREAHSRLYEYHKSRAKELPDTLEEMTPLFAAVAHGCQAGRHQEVLIEVYWKRISRGDEFFSTRKLGASGADLAALSGFFASLWDKPVDELPEHDKASLLNWAGFRLRALGRLAESAQPMQAGLEARIVQKSWDNAAKSASNLSELYLTIGDVQHALDAARQSVELADRSGDAFLRMGFRTTLAEALHQAGQLAEAEAAFREAEEMQTARQKEYPLLYSFQGFRYCDLLLSQGKHAEVQSRVAKFFEWRLPGDSLLDIALENLSLGRAHLLQVQQAPERSGAGETLKVCTTHLDRAVDGLRQAGQRSITCRAACWRARNCGG